MRISGLEKCSFVDYPGKLAAVVFLKGCNMNCSYCHNQELLKGDASSQVINEDDLFRFLQRRTSLLDAVVITGGEPTLNENLPEFIRRIREFGFLVKLDTNGTNPAMVRALIEEGLLDYVAMDVKTILSQYNRLCRTLVDTGAIVRSVKLLLDADIEYEFRTTVYPGLTESTLYSLAELLTGADKWVLQHYNPAGNFHIDSMDPDEVVEKPDLKKLTARFSAYIKSCPVRGKETPLELENWRPDLDSQPVISMTLDVPKLLS
ncbi:MAG: anaerobic ribonucleoside-triphosphate reductase activating protein [Acidobacteriota bacterium]